jgi:DMSO/TMAO reductase YedYZ molybdopterin-dependent catalytic subunit
MGLGIIGLVLLRGTGQLFAAAGRGDPNDFPVTITAGGSDRPDADTWRVSVEGDVAHPLTLGVSELRRRPLERHTYSLDCVLGWSVTREWGGVSLGALLDEAEPQGEVLSVRVRSTTGYEDVLAPRDAWAEGALVAWEVERVPLTPEHGYPGRLMVPNVIGEKCIKWIERITVVTRGSGDGDAA